MNKRIALELYQEARKFIIEQLCKENAEEILNRQLNPDAKSMRPKDIQELWRRLLESVINANMKAKVVGSHFDKIENALCDFDPMKFQARWTSGTADHPDTKFLDDVERLINPHTPIRRSHRSLWPQFFKSCVSSAKFISQFGDAEGFYAWADPLAENTFSNPGLPLILSQEIHGIGYALACDFLKEIGYLSYGKPDVHIKDIFRSIGLCSEHASDYEIQKILVTFANTCGVTAYHLDKLFWLIGSGYFGLNPEVGKNGHIGSKKKEFIRHLLDAGRTVRPD